MATTINVGPISPVDAVGNQISNMLVDAKEHRDNLLSQLGNVESDINRLSGADSALNEPKGMDVPDKGRR